jgi:NAD(P)-dependent dehydrogenase (short-subunit alcohol dehydrogenase family)
VSGRVAVVTGGGSGIGAATSRRLASDGHAVAVFDLNGESADEVARSIEADGGSASGYAVDVTDRAAIDAALDQVRSKHGRVTILVNSAGVSPFGPFLEITEDVWNFVLLVNLTGTFNCCQAAIPDMLAEGWGRIVNISSSSIHSGVPLLAPYVSAKSGVVGLTKSIALEFAPQGITVNTIPPGFIDTPMLRGAEAEGSVNVERSIAATPVGRPGRPEDIAAACSFLVSEDASYITGQIIGVNGGRNT